MKLREENEMNAREMNEIQLRNLDLNLLVVFEALMSEGSVVGASEVLGKTPSAVSHALRRLREQVGDPILVRVGGRMQPSPFALSLIEEVRPILRSIQRVMSEPEPYDAKTSSRVFRVVMPSFSDVVVSVLARISEEAPGVRVEWSKPSSHLYELVADGLIDLAHVGGELRLPDGLDSLELEPFTFMTFLRQGHPALKNWDANVWKTWPHLQVSINTNTISPVDTPKNKPKGRHIAAIISEFSGAAAVLARTDMLGTFPTLQMAGELDRFGLCAIEPPIKPRPFRNRFVWSKKLTSDAGSIWFREIVIDAYRGVQRDANKVCTEKQIRKSEPSNV